MQSAIVAFFFVGVGEGSSLDLLQYWLPWIYIPEYIYPKKNRTILIKESHILLTTSFINPLLKMTIFNKPWILFSPHLFINTIYFFLIFPYQEVGWFEPWTFLLKIQKKYQLSNKILDKPNIIITWQSSRLLLLNNTILKIILLIKTKFLK